MHVARVRILAIDTAAETACVGVVVDDVVRAEDLGRVSSQHGETFLSCVAVVLESTGLSRSEIDLIAVGLGPGSFTGVRIGLATAKGLAIGLGKPIVGVRTSRSLAASIDGTLRVVAIDGKKSEVFASVWSFDGGLTPLLEDGHGAPEVMAQRVRELLGERTATLVGSGASAYPAFGAALRVTRVDASHDVVRARWLAHEARLSFDAHGASDLAHLEPVYVRAADALLPGGRVP